MKLLLSALILLLLAISIRSMAETYPSKPIKLVIPFAAGSATDAAGRVLAQALSQRLGQSVIVDNRAGANGQLSYGTASTASLVGAETINAMAHTDLVGIGYKASPQAIVDLVAGRLQLMVADFATAMPQVKAGKLKVLAVTTAKRSALLPGVPPIAETLQGFDMTSWNGLFAPAGTPQAIVARLAQETLSSLAQPEVKATLAAIGFEVDPLEPVAFGRFVREQLDTWGKLIRAAKIQPE